MVLLGHMVKIIIVSKWIEFLLKKHIVKTIETSSHIDGYKCLNKLCYKDLFVFVNI